MQPFTYILSAMPLPNIDEDACLPCESPIVFRPAALPSMPDCPAQRPFSLTPSAISSAAVQAGAVVDAAKDLPHMPHVLHIRQQFYEQDMEEFVADAAFDANSALMSFAIPDALKMDVGSAVAKATRSGAVRSSAAFDGRLQRDVKVSGTRVNDYISSNGQLSSFSICLLVRNHKLLSNQVLPSRKKKDHPKHATSVLEQWYVENQTENGRAYLSARDKQELSEATGLSPKQVSRTF